MAGMENINFNPYIQIIFQFGTEEVPMDEVGQQAPVNGSPNFIYVKIKNRGTEIANNVKVNGYHSKSGAGLLLPNDVQPLSTAQIPIGTLAGNNTEEKIIGPFEWTPEINTYGYDSIIMIVSADNDSSNIDNFTMGETIPDWRLYQMTIILDREICFQFKVFQR